MFHRPFWSKIDAIIIGALLLSGTTAMVEASNRVVIDPPSETEEVATPQPTRFCATTALTGDVMFMRYAAQLDAANASTWCNP